MWPKSTPGSEFDEGLSPEQLIVKGQGGESETPPPVVMSAEATPPAPAGVVHTRPGATETPLAYAEGTTQALIATLSEPPKKTWNRRGHGKRVAPLLAFLATYGVTTLPHDPDTTQPIPIVHHAGSGEPEPFCDFDYKNGVFSAEGYECSFSFPGMEDIAGLLNGKAKVADEKPRDIVVVEGLFQATEVGSHRQNGQQESRVEVEDCETPITIKNVKRVEEWEKKVKSLKENDANFIPYDFSVEIIEQEKGADGSRRNHKVKIAALLSDIEIYQAGDPESEVPGRTITLKAGQEVPLDLDIQHIPGGCDFISQNISTDPNAAKILAEMVLLAIIRRKRKENKT